MKTEEILGFTCNVSVYNRGVASSSLTIGVMCRKN